MMNKLDLYAKIEPMIGFYEAYEELYDSYEKIIKELKPKTLLDVGCGNGNFLKRLDFCDGEGIDISAKMVQTCHDKGLKAECKRVEDVEKKYDVITAIADVLNYLDKDELKSFLRGVENSLCHDGYFLCDINTLFGFEEVASGVMVSEDEEGFLSVEADFLDGELVTDFTYFEKEKGCYQKYQWRIRQFYHEIKEIESITNLKLQKVEDIRLFSEDTADKVLLVFTNS